MSGEINRLIHNERSAIWSETGGLMLPSHERFNRILRNGINFFVDVDDTWGAHTEGWIEWSELTFPEERRHTLRDYKTYNYGKYHNLSYEEYRRRIHEFQRSSHYLEMQEIAGATQAIKRVKSAGNQVGVLTARDIIQKPETEFWIGQRIPLGHLTGIHFSANGHEDTTGQSKGEISKEQNADAVAEDYTMYALDIAKRGIHVFLHDREWNKDPGLDQHPFITRFYYWQQIPFMVERLKIGLLNALRPSGYPAFATTEGWYSHG